MARIIAVANQKGGVGKTTTVANLGVALAQLGKQVLLIDLDPQAALTASFGLDPYHLPRSMFSVIMNDDITLDSVLMKLDGLDGRALLGPASVDLAASEVQLVTAEARAHRLKRAFDAYKSPYDYILIDTPPSLGMLTLNSLVAATDVLVPVQTHYLAMRGVRALMETVWRVRRRLNTGLRLMGLVPTMFTLGDAHAAEVMDELREVFGVKVFPIPIVNSPAFAQAPVASKSLVQLRPEHEGARAYRKLAEEIIRHG